MPTVGVKFCGGWNPAIDRARVLQEVREGGGDLVFTDLAEKKPDTILFICGCAVACPVERLGYHGHPRLVVVAGETVDVQHTPEGAIAAAVLKRLVALTPAVV